MIEWYDPWVDLREAANYLHLSTRQLFTYRRRYAVRATKFGRDVYLPMYDVWLLDRLMRRCGRPSKVPDGGIPPWHQQAMLAFLDMEVDVLNEMLTANEALPGQITPLPMRGRWRVRQLRNLFVQMVPIFQTATTYDDLNNARAAALRRSNADDPVLSMVQAYCDAMVACNDPGVLDWDMAVYTASHNERSLP